MMRGLFFFFIIFFNSVAFAAVAKVCDDLNNTVSCECTDIETLEVVPCPEYYALIVYDGGIAFDADVNVATFCARNKCEFSQTLDHFPTGEEHSAACKSVLGSSGYYTSTAYCWPRRSYDNGLYYITSFKITKSDSLGNDNDPNTSDPSASEPVASHETVPNRFCGTDGICVCFDGNMKEVSCDAYTDNPYPQQTPLGAPIAKYCDSLGNCRCYDDHARVVSCGDFGGTPIPDDSLGSGLVNGDNDGSGSDGSGLDGFGEGNFGGDSDIGGMPEFDSSLDGLPDAADVDDTPVFNFNDFRVKSYFSSSGSCPQSPVVDLGILGFMTIPYDYICSIAGIIRLLLISFAWLIGLRIIANYNK